MPLFIKMFNTTCFTMSTGNTDVSSFGGILLCEAAAGEEHLDVTGAILVSLVGDGNGGLPSCLVRGTFICWHVVEGANEGAM